MRIGQGFDLHKLGKGRDLLLGGILIESEKGEIAHSDGDVLLHAIIDSILGACGAEDIGTLFSDTDPKYKDVSSTELLEQTLAMYPVEIINIDCTIILQTPKLKDYVPKIKNNLAKLLSISTSQIAVKAKTSEKILGELGSGDAIIAQAVILVEEIKELWV
ncbi:MAG: 2-C-methyl-D-erythritol 2,4-cyclodiphosphate synthase [Sphaerochaetaceae bacterium]|nr:2-C-methyl-D-erythritol 2,4-cyclodiphosphate synthase [Sphaerochaetaceae bacterium]MDC7237485.1 2-C-methyl-D-erythritol 2,4-cyclodiphosphate synthase [Sphaerochaetaceae bacterium]MDC7243525.1 2-C-methyl-D-erythritol 2,4-cyclodiphosphate synthase [Sphaerochaetaceae bacterium]